MPDLVFHEKPLRLAVFISAFLLLAFWEKRSSRRPVRVPPATRWPGNLGLTFLNTVILRMIFPASALGAAYLAQRYRFGLFQQVEVPSAFSIVFTVVFLDWMIYYQHRAFHALPWLWKIHRTHHTDLEVDVTTGLRFHPIEMVLSMLFKSAVILALGAPALGVLLFEVILNASSLFSHSNVRLPARWDGFLRRLIVTPDMHRVHHSVLPKETNSNFGFNLSLWDKLLGTYRAEPEKGQESMTIGLSVFRDLNDHYLDRLFLQPFLDPEGRAALKNLTQKD